MCVAYLFHVLREAEHFVSLFVALGMENWLEECAARANAGCQIVFSMATWLAGLAMQAFCVPMMISSCLLMCCWCDLLTPLVLVRTSFPVSVDVAAAKWDSLECVHLLHHRHDYHHHHTQGMPSTVFLLDSQPVAVPTGRSFSEEVAGLSLRVVCSFLQEVKAEDGDVHL